MDSSKDFGKLAPKDAQVSSYQPNILKNQKAKSYTEFRRNFNPEREKTSAQFSLSEMVSDQLAMEDKEQKRFNQKVQAEVERIIQTSKEDAIKEGYEEGLKNGIAKAYDEEKAKIEEKLQVLQELTEAIQNSIKMLAAKYESELIEISFKIADIILSHEIAKDPTIIASTVNDILERISKDDDVVIKLSKKLVDAVPVIEEKVKQQSSRNGHIHFEIDSELEKGSVVVECVSGEIASVIKEKLDNLKESIMKRLGEVS